MIEESLLRWGLPEGRILAGYYGFCANILFTSQAVKNLSAHPTIIYVLGCDFWVYLEIESSSQRISKIYGNRRFWRMFGVLLKLEVEFQN